MTKKYFFRTIMVLVVSQSLTAQQANDVLMKVGDIPVTVSEFKYIYEKNNGAKATYSKESIEEYLDLYTKFKLKVSEAKTNKIDTISSLKEELDGYKRQLSNSYIMDKGVNDYLLKELRERVKKDIRFSHIFISVPANAAPDLKETKKAEIDQAYERLQTGAPFENVVTFFSEDKITNQSGGDLGFYSAMMPNGFYELENAMYTTPVGSYSRPIKSRIGWHIIKVTDTRLAYGEIEVAHILIRKEGQDAKSKIDEVYTKLKSGSDWNAMVLSHSEDEKSSKANGMLPAFGINTYERAFENASFALKEKGQISEPFETSAGWHIVKLINRSEALDDETFNKVFESRIKADERYNITKLHLLETIRTNSGYTENLELLSGFAGSLTEDFYTFKWQPAQTDVWSKSLIDFGGEKKYSLADFVEFAQKNTRIRLRYDKSVNTYQEAIDALFEAFKEEKTIDFEQGNLVKKYDDFRSLMREYEEGILLFEVTKNAVWDRANQDSIGLAQFFESHRNAYMNDEKVLATKISFSTDNTSLANEVFTQAKKSTKALTKKYNKKEEFLKFEPVEIAKSDDLAKNLEFKSKAISPMNQSEGNYTIYKVEKVIPASPKSLKESRGYVVADYQDQLEKDWVENLRKKYKVEVNNDVLQKLIK